MGYYMCPGGGQRFVAAGSRPRNLCACKPFFPLRVFVCWRVLRSGGWSFCVAPSFSRFFGGFPPQTPVSCLTFLFCARCGLTSSRAYVFCGWCSAGVIGRFCVGLSPRPAALRSAAFALRAPACGLSPAAAFSAIRRTNKCLLLSGALPPLTPARGARAGARCFSWYLAAFGRVPISTAKAYRSCASIR